MGRNLRRMQTGELVVCMGRAADFFQLIFTALTENDHDIIDDLILSAWSVGLGATPVVGPIQDIRQRLVGLSQTKLADGRVGLPSGFQ